MENFNDVVLNIVSLVVIGVIIFIAAKISETNRAAKKRGQHIQILEQIADSVDLLIAKMNAESDLKTKSKHCKSALNELEAASEYPECRDVFANFDKLYEETKSFSLIIPVIGYLKKAHKYQFKKKDSSEKNALLDALYEIEQNNITDEDFLSAGSHDEETGEIVSIGMIEERLKELGWEREN